MPRTLRQIRQLGDVVDDAYSADELRLRLKASKMLSARRFREIKVLRDALADLNGPTNVKAYTTPLLFGSLYREFLPTTDSTPDERLVRNSGTALARARRFFRRLMGRC